MFETYNHYNDWWNHENWYNIYLNGGGGGGGISRGGGGPWYRTRTPDDPVQETCGKFRITLYDSNSGEEGTTYEFDDGLFDIVQMYIDSEYTNT